MIEGISNLSNEQLLAVWAEVGDELRRRGITRTANNPCADYAETLVANATGGIVQGNSHAAFDVLAPTGERIQVKARRETLLGSVNHFSAIRDLEKRGFDYVVGVIFTPDFTVKVAWRYSWEAVKRHAAYVAHTNSYRLSVPRGSALTDPDVVRITLAPGGVLPPR